MKRILVTGATGFIGSHLVRALSARGDAVTVLTRSLRSGAGPGAGVRQVVWTPEARGDWYGAVDGQDAVVSLAGEQAVGVRWTDAAKQRILDSRVQGTRQLVQAIAEAEKKPHVLVGASGVGYYGPRAGGDALDETAPAGTDFLASVCVAWEAAEDEARASGLRVVKARIGTVLGADGGALQELVKLFRAFAGGPIGDGRQVVSWIHVDDLVAILLRAIDDPELSGPINAVAPNAVTNAELSREIGRVLGRPSWLRVPALALKARFGEGAAPLLGGQRAVPSALLPRGHVFHFPDLAGALEASLG